MPLNLHPEYKTKEEYYKPIEDLIDKTVNYCDMICKVVQISKYVEPKDFYIVGFRCIYILKILEPTKEQLEHFNEGFLYTNSWALIERAELINN